MSGSTHPKSKYALLLGVLLGGIALTSCEASVNHKTSAPTANSVAEVPQDVGTL